MKRALFQLLAAILAPVAAFCVPVPPIIFVTSAPAYLINQNFEGTGYDNGETWTETGTPDEDYTATILKGSQSLIVSSGPNYTQISFAGQTDIWFHCRVRYSAFGSSTNIQLTNTAETVLAGVNISGGGAVTLDANGGVSGASATTATTGTNYYLWMHYVSGGICELAMSTATTRPSADGSGDVYLTRTGASDTCTKLILYGGGGGTAVVDNVLVSTSAIGNDP